MSSTTFFLSPHWQDKVNRRAIYNHNKPRASQTIKPQLFATLLLRSMLYVMQTQQSWRFFSLSVWVSDSRWALASTLPLSSIHGEPCYKGTVVKKIKRICTEIVRHLLCGQECCLSATVMLAFHFPDEMRRTGLRSCRDERGLVDPLRAHPHITLLPSLRLCLINNGLVSTDLSHHTAEYYIM